MLLNATFPTTLIGPTAKIWKARSYIQRASRRRAFTRIVAQSVQISLEPSEREIQGSHRHEACRLHCAPEIREGLPALQKPDLRISEIAFEVGFQSLAIQSCFQEILRSHRQNIERINRETALRQMAVTTSPAPENLAKKCVVDLPRFRTHSDRSA
jgi:AraC-like DNA-binding protein